MDETKFETLLGKTLRSIDGADKGSESIKFVTDTGEVFEMYHSQCCCEGVDVESVVGDIADLIGTPILLAEEATSESTPEDVKLEYQPESQTWTFYKLRTIKGSVDIRWHGQSNGYYSERVDFRKVMVVS